MYLPPHFAEHDQSAHFDLIDQNPLGLLITHGPEGLLADHVPFLLDRDHSVLRAHVAKANPQWRNIGTGASALVIFSALDHYVTPSWYATKRETGKVVPTWNYVSVEARGPAVAIQDNAWLRAQIDALTVRHEYDRPKPWAVSDAPDDFIASQMKGIVGIEISIATTSGKWKVSQNRPADDKAGVVAGLEESATPSALEMARLLRAKG